MAKKINVAVDGTAGSGKSFVFKMVASQVGYELIDTGLMYRAFTYFLFSEKISFEDQDAMIAALPAFDFSIKNGSVFLNGTVDVTEQLTSNDVLENINKVTVVEKVRAYMVELQRKLGNRPGVIMLGRDITTVVLPDAKLKIYLDAPLEVRAQRRFEQNQEQGISDSYDEVLEKITLRDQTDKNREFGALIRAKDAWYLDTSLQSVEQLVGMIVAKIKELEGDLHG